MYTDDLVDIAETEYDLVKRLNEWKDFVENTGMRVNMNKTKVMISGYLVIQVLKATLVLIKKPNWLLILQLNHYQFQLQI